MKLVTLVEVTHADVNKKLTGGTKTGIVRIEIGNRNLICREGDFLVEAEFKYIDSEGNELPNEDDGVFKVIGTDKLVGLSKAINPFIPASDNIVDRFNDEVKAVAIKTMSTSFSIEMNQIGEYEEPTI